MDEFDFPDKEADDFVEEEKPEVVSDDDEESTLDENVMILSDDESDEDELAEKALPQIDDNDVKEIKFNQRLHTQHLTLNEMTKIVMNIDDMINNNVIQVPKGVKRADFIFETIVENKLDIVIRRPIDFTSVVIASLSELKINKTKLKEKLNKLF